MKLVYALAGVIVLAGSAWIVASVLEPPLRAEVAEPPAAGAPSESKPSTRAAARSAPNANRVDEARLADDSTSVANEREPVDARPRVVLRGRFVHPNGRPAGGVRWTVFGSRPSTEGAPGRERSEPTVRPAGTTGADGRFQTSFELSEDRRLRLSARLTGFVHYEHKWKGAQPDARFDLGDIELVRTGAVEGQVVSAAGLPLAQAGLPIELHAGRLGSRHTAESDADGRFHFADVDPGQVVLRLDAKFSDEMKRVHVRAGTTTTVELVHDGSDPLRRIEVVISCEPFQPRLYAVDRGIDFGGAILLETTSGTFSATRPRAGSQSYLLSDVPEGAWTLRIEHPDFAPWTMTGVRPGDTVRARLRGSCAVVLDVRDEAGRAIERYDLTAIDLGADFRPNVFTLHEGMSSDAQPLEGGRYEGLFPGDWELGLATEGERVSVSVLGLVAGETRALTVRLESRAEIAGRAVLTTGEPAAGQTVLLLRPAHEGDSPSSLIARANMPVDDPTLRTELQSVRSDDDGHFRFEVEAGRYALSGTRAIGLRGATSAFAVRAGQTLDDLVLELPVGGWIRGTLDRPADGSRDRIGVVHPNVSQEEWMLGGGAHIVKLLLVDDDGSFRFGPLVPGPAELYLAPYGLGGGWGPQGRPLGALLLGEVEVVDGREVEVHLERDAMAKLGVRVFVNGRPEGGLKVTFAKDGAILPLRRRTAPDGRCDTVRLSAGRYDIAVAHGRKGFRTTFRAAVELDSGEQRELELALEVASGQLSIFEPDGAPARDVQVLVLPVGDWPHHVVAHRTDSSGIVSLRLATGDYLLGGTKDEAWPFSMSESELEHFVPFTWTGTGPLEAQLVLRR